MSLPVFYRPESVGTLYAPDTVAAVNAGYNSDAAPSSSDSIRTALLLIDMQVDFIHADGALSVAGAIDDTRRTLEWIFRNLGSLTTIVASLDSHVPIQIFSPTWWVNQAKEHPQPFTVITAAEVQAGKWSPLYDEQWSRDYLRKLEDQHKKQLMIWSYHTLIGTPGHALTPALYEAIAYHTAARQSQPVFVNKGTIPNTENYSIFEPEVKRDDIPNGGLNVDLLTTLAGYDRIYIAGQAKSHCVLETVTSLMRFFAGKPNIISKLRLLMDCMSSVAHPAIDFDALANAAYNEFAGQGLIQVLSTDPLR